MNGCKSYPFLKLWSQGILRENVKLDLLLAEQQGRFDHSEGFIQTVPTCHYGQVHQVLIPGALGQGLSHIRVRFAKT